jgi:hypothetical protein
MPCGCQYGASRCTRCGQRFHLVNGLCPAAGQRGGIPASAADVAALSRHEQPGQFDCGKFGSVGMKCTECGTTVRASRPAGDPKAALAQLENKMDRAKRSETRSIRVGRVALEILRQRYDSP